MQLHIEGPDTLSIETIEAVVDHYKRVKNRKMALYTQTDITSIIMYVKFIHHEHTLKMGLSRKTNPKILHSVQEGAHAPSPLGRFATHSSDTYTCYPNTSTPTKKS